MREPNEIKSSPELEEKLTSFYQNVTPEADFADRLQVQLVAKASALQESDVSRSRGNIFSSLLRRPLLVGALAVLLVLTAAIGIIGPQKVLAEVQRLFGYLPGYGFLQANQVRVLADPVEVRQGDVTLQVKNVVADSVRTVVTFYVTGLSPNKYESPTDDQRAIIVLPDGTRWTDNSMSASAGMGEMQVSLEYPPLPLGVEQIILVMGRLPTLPARFAPENWSIPLTLTEVSSTPVAQGADTPPAVLIPPYVPQNASASAQGVTVSVLQVAQSEKEVGVQVQFSWQNSTWESLQGALGTLRDENGQQLQFVDQTSVGLGGAYFATSAPGLLVRTYRYSLPPTQVKKYNFTFDQVWFQAKTDTEFTFDPGSSPKAGQTWDLSNTPGTDLVIAGVPVKVLSATYDGEVPGVGIKAPDSPVVTQTIDYQLSFLVEPRPTEGFSLQSLSLTSPGYSNGSGSEGFPGGSMRVFIALPEPLSDHPIDIRINEAALAVLGTWQIEWVPPQP